MEKDNRARFCDFCGAPALHRAGKYVVCARHLREGEKVASADVPLRAAPIYLADKHKQK